MDRAKDFDAARKLLRQLEVMKVREDAKAVELIAEYLTDARIDAAPTIIQYDPKNPPPPGLFQGVKRLTDDEQGVLEILRGRTSLCPTREEWNFLIALADRLPREPRKKTLGQVLYEATHKTDRSWQLVYAEHQENYERGAQAVVDEYVLRTRGTGGSTECSTAGDTG